MCADLCIELPESVKRLTSLMTASNEAYENVSSLLEQYERWGYSPVQLERLIYRYVFFHHPACSAYRFLWTYIPPIIILLGSFGNILAFLVLRHPSTRYVSAFVYLAVRSVVDEVVLIVGLLRRWIDYLVNRKLEDTSAVLCKLAQFAGVSASFLSVWLTVTLTAERALVVSSPLHGTRIITYSRVRRLISVLTIICVLLSVHFFFTVDVITVSSAMNSPKQISLASGPAEVNQTHFLNLSVSTLLTPRGTVFRCNFKPNFSYLAWLWTTLDAVIYCYLPFILIFGLNVVIVYHVNLAQKKQHRIRVRSSVIQMQQWSKASNTSGEQVNNVRQMTVMLLVVSFAFLVTTTAIAITKILSQVLELRGSNRRFERLSFQIADTVAELLMYVNHAMNFYLFCATGKRFRSKLWLLLGKCRSTLIMRETLEFQPTACVEPDAQFPTCSNMGPRLIEPVAFQSSWLRKSMYNHPRNQWIENFVCNAPCTRCQSAPPYGRSVTYSTGSVPIKAIEHVWEKPSRFSQSTPDKRLASSISQNRRFQVSFARNPTPSTDGVVKSLTIE